MVTTKHKRRSLVPLSLPTSQPHPGTSYYWFSRLQGLGIMAFEPQKDHLKISKISKFQSTKQQKTPNVSFQKAVLFKMRQRNIFLTKRQNSMVVSACELNLDWLSSELAKFPQTLQTAKGRNRFEVMFFLSPQIFCSQTETFPGSCLLLAKEPAMESEETSQQATSQL